jgi:hypothetical protein
MRAPGKLILAIFGSLALISVGRSEDNSGATMFAQLKSLAGDWRGTFEWSGARTGKGSMDASYYLTGNGSALVENLISDGAPVMTSVYHLDGPALRMTHYCGAQNQPRLKAERIGSAQGAIDFGFVDITNLKSADAPHVHGLELRLIDPNHITVTFLFQGGGKESRELIALDRAGTRSSEKGSGGGGSGGGRCAFHCSPL